MRCSVCHSENHSFYRETGPMMVDHDQDRRFRFLRCVDCETVFLENPVKEQDLGEFYPDDYLPYRGEKAWGKYARAVRRQDHSLNRKRVGLVTKHLDLKKNNQVSILDIGCGKPDFLRAMKQHTHADCFGIDFKAAQWDDPIYAGIHLTEESVDQYNTLERFDAITAWHYLEHDYHPVLTIEKCLKLLKPGGIVIVEVPMYQGLLAKMQQQHWVGEPDIQFRLFQQSQSAHTFGAHVPLHLFYPQQPREFLHPTKDVALLLSFVARWVHWVVFATLKNWRHRRRIVENSAKFFLQI